VEEAIKFDNKGGTANPQLDPALAPFGLSKDEERDPASFLGGVSGCAHDLTSGFPTNHFPARSCSGIIGPWPRPPVVRQRNAQRKRL
jgi:hypothetical protein